MNNAVIIDCHYCDNAVCNSPTDPKCECYCDDGYYSHHVYDSKTEAEECLWFRFCDIFPKL